MNEPRNDLMVVVVAKMRTQTSTQKSVAFDRIYEKVPGEHVARLKEFRLTHPYKQLIVGEIKWESYPAGEENKHYCCSPALYR